MIAKTSPARRAAFMAAVAETGNQTLACERAKVSRSWVQLQRSTDPAFRAELAAATSLGRARVRAARAAGGSMAPGRGWATQGGEELVARGGNGRRTQIARARLKQWTPRAEARFLEVLAGSANVRAVCAAVGLTPASAYNHRHRWADFAERWENALEIGYERIEAALALQAGAALACGLGGPGDADGDEDGNAIMPDLTITHMTCDAALQVLRLYQRRVYGPGSFSRRRQSAWQASQERLAGLR